MHIKRLLVKHTIGGRNSAGFLVCNGGEKTGTWLVCKC